MMAATADVAERGYSFPASRRRERWRYGWYVLRRSPSGLFGLAVLAIVLVAAAFGPSLWTLDPDATDPAATLLSPSAAHPFGTDNYGRDILARVFHGVRLDLGVALVVALVATVAGTVIGVATGYLGGRVDQIAMRVTDVLMAFPSFILAIGIAAVLGNDIRNVITAISVAYTPVMIRVVRAHTLGLRSAQYVLASKAVGTSSWRIMRSHLIPNTLSPILVQATLFMAWAVLDTAGLSFIGVGIRPPTAELGAMTAEGAEFVVSGSWWYALFPGLVIMALVLAFNLLGDALRDILDPHFR
jgi:peptide/nickel transport system permease protein